MEWAREKEKKGKEEKRKKKGKRKRKGKSKQFLPPFVPSSSLLFSLPPLKKKEKENEKKRKEKGNAKREARETENATKSAPLFGILFYYLNTYILLYSIARKSPSPGTADIFFFLFIYFSHRSQKGNTQYELT